LQQGIGQLSQQALPGSQPLAFATTGAVRPTAKTNSASRIFLVMTSSPGGPSRRKTSNGWMLETKGEDQIRRTSGGSRTGNVVGNTVGWSLWRDSGWSSIPTGSTTATGGATLTGATSAPAEAQGLGERFAASFSQQSCA
jgi:hypothetical protein